MGVLAQLNMVVLEQLNPLEVIEVKVAPGTEIENIAGLLQNPLVEFAEPDFIYSVR
jgi:hypothetical protein